MGWGGWGIEHEAWSLGRTRKVSPQALNFCGCGLKGLNQGAVKWV